MVQFIAAVFVILGAVFWIASGGAEFEPEQRPEPAQSWRPSVPDTTPASSAPARAQSNAGRLPGAALAPASSVPAAQISATDGATDGAREPAPQSAAETIPAPEGTTAPDTPQTAPTDVATQPPEDLRQVSAARVNLRSGPSTDYRVLDTLTRGTQVELLEIDELGAEPWAKLRVTQTGLEGWMALRFVVAQ